MQQRVTYLLPLGAGTNPADIVFNQTELVFKSTGVGAQERRLTFALSELPRQIRDALQDYHEIHIRIVPDRNYHVYSPAVSRLSPGFHAFVTPKNSSTETEFCGAIQQLFADFKCDSDEASFIRPPVASTRFARSSTFQYYQGPNDYQSILASLTSKLCGLPQKDHGLDSLCLLASAAHLENSVNYLDVDFDVISHAVTITTAWSKLHPASTSGGRLRVARQSNGGRLEVGVLQEEEAREPEQLSLGGFLTVVGEDDHTSQTLFSFPARHHPLPASDTTNFTAHFQQPTGLHPKFELTFPTASLRPPKSTCALHAYWTLPSTLFIDRYQLSDPLFLASQNLASLRSIHGEQDLEAPEWTITRWGSAALLELALPPPDSPSARDWTVTIPTHLRYVHASGRAGGHAAVSVPWPVVFWACEAEEGLKFATNPFDRTNLGYDGLFGPKTMFYHVPPARAEGEWLVETVRVPVIDQEGASYVPVGTMLAVLLGFAWVCWQMFRGVRGSTVEGKKRQ